jgi:hypothetical protein
MPWCFATAANPNGLIGASGRLGQKRQIAALMDSLAPHYGDDFWFLAHQYLSPCGMGQGETGVGCDGAVKGLDCPRIKGQGQIAALNGRRQCSKRGRIGLRTYRVLQGFVENLTPSSPFTKGPSGHEPAVIAKLAWHRGAS